MIRKAIINTFLSILLVLTSITSFAAPISNFIGTYASADTYGDGVINFNSALSSEAFFSDADGVANAFADFGVLKAFSSDPLGSDIGGRATAAWGDSFTFTGGSGIGSTTFVFSLDGNITGQGFVRYSLFSDFDLTNGTSASSVPLRTLIDYQTFGGGTASLPLTLFSYTTDFTYDEAFTIQAVLEAYVHENGESDFFNTGRLNTVIIPTGATLVTGSGTVYGITPVPEPETYAMLLAGLGLVGWAARRRKQAEA